MELLSLLSYFFWSFSPVLITMKQINEKIEIENWNQALITRQSLRFVYEGWGRRWRGGWSELAIHLTTGCRWMLSERSLRTVLPFRRRRATIKKKVREKDTIDVSVSRWIIVSLTPMVKRDVLTWIIFGDWSFFISTTDLAKRRDYS